MAQQCNLVASCYRHSPAVFASSAILVGIAVPSGDVIGDHDAEYEFEPV
jgi:hypothetical protein